AALGIDSFFKGLSCGKRMMPKRYSVIPANTNIHIAMKTSYPNMPQCIVMSAIDKNLNARASSKNPSTTLTEFIHDPDLGSELSQAGKAAKRPNGSARAVEKPSMTMNGPSVLVAD